MIKTKTNLLKTIHHWQQVPFHLQVIMMDLVNQDLMYFVVHDVENKENLDEDLLISMKQQLYLNIELKTKKKTQ
jgi:hypothetical protein